MRVERRDERGVAILRLSGKIDSGEGSITLRWAVRTALEGGVKKMILDLAQVTAIDETGVDAICEAERSVAGRGGQLTLTSVPPSVLDQLEITKLTTKFDIYEHEAEAIDALG